jgi:bacteriorhodopsin
MTIILFLLATGIAILIISMIVMWYILVMALMFAGFIAGATYWLTFMLVDGIANDPQIGSVAGIIAAIAIFVGLAFFGMSSDKIRNKNNGS